MSRMTNDPMTGQQHFHTTITNDGFSALQRPTMISNVPHHHQNVLSTAGEDPSLINPNQQQQVTSGPSQQTFWPRHHQTTTTTPQNGGAAAFHSTAFPPLQQTRNCPPPSSLFYPTSQPFLSHQHFHQLFYQGGYEANGNLASCWKPPQTTAAANGQLPSDGFIKALGFTDREHQQQQV
jgi:hypothetical protein